MYKLQTYTCVILQECHLKHLGGSNSHKYFVQTTSDRKREKAENDEICNKTETNVTWKSDFIKTVIFS